MNVTTVRGTRVEIRTPAPGDRAAYCALERRSRPFLAPWVPRPGRRHPFDALLEGAAAAGNAKFLVWRREDGRLLGGMNLNNIVLGVFRNAALGYWVGAEYARRGYATEALQLALRHAFRTLRLHRVEANIMPSNGPSRALVQRAGFRLEGVSRRMLKIAGRWEDHERWALLREEWRPQRSARRT